MNPDTKRLFVFGGLTGVFLIPLSVLYWITRSSIWLNILMLTPAAAVLLTRLLTKEGWKDLYIKPYWKGKTKWYLMAYLFTPVLAYAGAALYFPHQPSDGACFLSGGGMGLAGLSAAQTVREHVHDPGESYDRYNLGSMARAGDRRGV